MARVKFLKHLKYYAIFTVIILLIVEIGLSIINYFPNGYYTQSPNTSHYYKENPSNYDGISGAYSLSFDALGSRSVSDYSKAKHKLVVFGGSTTICSALSQDKIWTAHLDKKLGDNYWVGNFGKVGNSSNHHLFQFEHILDKPELADVKTVLILVGVNDCRGFLKSKDLYINMSDSDIKKSAFTHLPNSELFFFQRLNLYKISKIAARRIHFLSQPRRPVDYLKKYKSDKVPNTELPDLTDGLNHYERNLKNLIRKAKERKINLIFLTQPTLWQENLAEEYKTLLAARSHYNKTPLYTGKALNELMTAFNKRLISVCNLENIAVIDLQLPKNKTIFYDDMHFNETGAKVVAEKVHTFLKQNNHVFADE